MVTYKEAGELFEIPQTTLYNKNTTQTKIGQIETSKFLVETEIVVVFVIVVDVFGTKFQVYSLQKKLMTANLCFTEKILTLFYRLDLPHQLNLVLISNYLFYHLPEV